jgi:hypothetical protein
MATYKDIRITWQFLDNHPNSYFIFGDNLQRRGKGGAATIRDHPHAIGFITKKFPDNNDGSFYMPEEYSSVFFEELKKLEKVIKSNPHKTFYISKLGAGLANKFRIWELLVQHNLTLTLEKYNNVVFCWEDRLS